MSAYSPSPTSSSFPDLSAWLASHAAHLVYVLHPREHDLGSPTVEHWRLPSGRVIYVVLYAPRDGLSGAWALAPEVGTSGRSASTFEAVESMLGLAHRASTSTSTPA